MDGTGNLEPGDLVHLRSGSARLTVVRVHLNNHTNIHEVDLAWMHYETQELRTARLPVTSLIPASERPTHPRNEVPY